MAGIGQKLETKGVIMTLLSLVLIGTGCEDKIDSPAVNPSEGKTVEVTLNIGLADEADGYTLSAPSETKSSVTAFSYTIQPAMATKGTESSLKPDKLYKLEIQQYDRSGGRIGGMSNVVAEQEIGSAISLTLTANPDCQLVIVAWGKGNTSTTLGTGNLASAQTKSINASAISELNPSNQEHMNQMPYVLHLEHVCVEDNTIKSIEGKDVRLLLRRLATRLTLDWTYSYSGYQLKQILLQSIPLDYKVVVMPDGTDKTYPSLLDQYTTIQLTNTQIGSGTYSCWIPANVRGSNPAATSQVYRIKSNAPTGSSYIDFIASNTSETKKKLSYRVYLGGSESTDFNLYGNTDYNYTIKINHTNLPVNDRRVTIIDPIAASENNSNLVPTANCFMVAPGGAFCFDPLMFRQNDKDIENTTLKGWIDSEGDIAYVKLLWQTKENGDVGDPVMGVANSETDHTNIVDLKNGLIYCRVAPNTTGGSGLIAAYNKNNQIIWSWHVWVTDYRPSDTGNETVLEPVNKRKLRLKKDTEVIVMMDRNLGAYAGYTEVPSSILDMSKANGFHYQKGRKDPFPGSYTFTTLPGVYQFTLNKDYPPKHMLNRYKEDGISWIIPTDLGYTSLRNAYMNPISIARNNGSQWCSDNPLPQWGTTKTFNDPCPAGWRIPGSSVIQVFVGYNQTSILPDIFNNATANGGLLLKYDDTSNRTYGRFTGYPPNQAQLNYVGTNGYMTVWESNKVLAISVSSVIIGGMRDYDAHTTRCIQERN